jgi:hypothetical protein
MYKRSRESVANEEGGGNVAVAAVEEGDGPLKGTKRPRKTEGKGAGRHRCAMRLSERPERQNASRFGWDRPRRPPRTTCRDIGTTKKTAVRVM